MIFSDVIYDILSEDEMTLLCFTINQNLSSDYRDPRYCQVVPTVSNIHSLSGLNEEGTQVKDSLLTKIKDQYL
jgi:hypothetical protein